MGPGFVDGGNTGQVLNLMGFDLLYDRADRTRTRLDVLHLCSMRLWTLPTNNLRRMAVSQTASRTSWQNGQTQRTQKCRGVLDQIRLRSIPSFRFVFGTHEK